MATASRKVRRERRAKRELTLAYKGLDIALRQRDQARMIANALETELKKYTDDPFPADEPEAKPEPSLTITKVAEPEEPQNVGD